MHAPACVECLCLLKLSETCVIVLEGSADLASCAGRCEQGSSREGPFGQRCAGWGRSCAGLSSSRRCRDRSQARSSATQPAHPPPNPQAAHCPCELTLAEAPTAGPTAIAAEAAAPTSFSAPAPPAAASAAVAAASASVSAPADSATAPFPAGSPAPASTAGSCQEAETAPHALPPCSSKWVAHDATPCSWDLIPHACRMACRTHPPGPLSPFRDAPPSWGQPTQATSATSTPPTPTHASTAPTPSEAPELAGHAPTPSKAAAYSICSQLVPPGVSPPSPITACKQVPIQWAPPNESPLEACSTQQAPSAPVGSPPSPPATSQSTPGGSFCSTCCEWVGQPGQLAEWACQGHGGDCEWNPLSPGACCQLGGPHFKPPTHCRPTHCRGPQYFRTDGASVGSGHHRQWNAAAVACNGWVQRSGLGPQSHPTHPAHFACRRQNQQQQDVPALPLRELDAKWVHAPFFHPLSCRQHCSGWVGERVKAHPHYIRPLQPAISCDADGAAPLPCTDLAAVRRQPVRWVVSEQQGSAVAAGIFEPTGQHVPQPLAAGHGFDRACRPFWAGRHPTPAWIKAADLS